MDAKFSPRVREVISLSREEALRLGHNYIGVEHLLLGIIKEGDGMAIRILEGLNCDLQKLRKLVEGSVRPNTGKPGGSTGNIPLVKQAEKILKITYLEAKIFKSAIIGTEHLLLSILKDEDNVATKSIQAFNIDYDVAKEEFENLLAYSPLHNIKSDVCYPTTLITTASRDDRVVPSHSFKFAAKLQEYQSCDNPILIRVEDRAGHGAGTPKDKRINQISEIYGYALDVINN